MSKDFLPDDYVEVHDRVKEFRKDHKDGQIITEIVDKTKKIWVFKVSVYRKQEEDRPTATGYGHASAEADSFVGDKWREKAETVAVGRALAFLGYKIEGGIASKEEVESVKKNNSPSKSQKKSKKDLNVEDIKKAITKKEKQWSESAFSDAPTEGQLQKFNSFWNGNVEGNDNDRYRFLSEVTDRGIKSSKDLLKGEISALIELTANETMKFVKVANKIAVEGTEEMFE